MRRRWFAWGMLAGSMVAPAARYVAGWRDDYRYCIDQLKAGKREAR